jgi:hypothetical protein
MALKTLSRAVGAGLILAAGLISASCFTLGSPAVWADGDVRDLESNKPIAGARIVLENTGTPPNLSNTDQSDLAGHFAVFQSLPGESGRIPILVVADGYKPAEFSLPPLQSNTLLVRLATTSSPHKSTIEYMAALPGDGSGADSDCGSD